MFVITEIAIIMKVSAKLSTLVKFMMLQNQGCPSFSLQMNHLMILSSHFCRE